jgi:hypothetical protein
MGSPLTGATAWHRVGTEAAKSLDVLCRRPQMSHVHKASNSDAAAAAAPALCPLTWGGNKAQS